MPRSKGRWRKNGLVVALAVLGLVVGTAGPAAAQEAVGAGAGAGFEYAPVNTQECGTPETGAEYNHDEFRLTHAANYDAVNPSGPNVALYAGTIETYIRTERVVQAPQGARPGTCGGIVVPEEVDLTSVTIRGTSPLGTVSRCSMGVGDEGYYLRVGTEVVFDFTVDCTFTTLTGTVTVNDLHHHHVGTQIPCVQSVVTQEGCDPLPEPGATSVMQTQFVAQSVQDAPPPPL